MARYVISNLLGLVGAIIGGVLGFYTFRWLFEHGFYGLMIPGALVGLGCSLLAQHPSSARGLLCGAAALGLGIFTEWKFRPFAADESFSYFMSHLTQLSPVTYLMLGVGTVISGWIGGDAGFGGGRATFRKPASRSD
jgi:hypothetical protein